MDNLAIVLPGRGYTALGPAIRFPVLAAEELGFRPVLIEYPAEAIEAKDVAAVVADVRRQVQAALDTGPAARVTIVAKSLGTRVAAQITDLFDDVDDLAVVWLTPLFGDAEVREAVIGSGWRSLIVAGDQDPYHDEDGVAEVTAALDASVLELAGADHALEVPGDVATTITGLREVAIEVRRFLAERLARVDGPASAR